MTLARPIAGEAEDAARDHAQCGSLAATSVIQTVYPKIVVPPLDNSSAQQIAAAVARVCPAAHMTVIGGNLATVAASQIALGHYVLGLVHCTSQAVPCPPAQAKAAHWIALYDAADAAYYQCWTATFQSGADLAVDSDGLGPHLAIWFPTTEDDGMFLCTTTRTSAEGADPHGPGAVYLCEGTPAQPGMFKRWISGVVASALPDEIAHYGQVVQNFDAFVLDRMVELAPIALTYPTLEDGAVPIVSGVLTAAQAAALAQIPAVFTLLQKIEAGLHAT